jgi:hypothetical protein
VRRALFVLLGAVLVPLAFTTPASAHSDTGILAVEALPPAAADASTVTVRARLVYDNDMHGVPGVAVTATGIGPDGATLAPTVLGDVGEGEYETAITFPVPGAWALTISSLAPAATAELAVDVAETGPATTVPTTSPPTTTEPSDGSAGADDAEGDDPPAFLFIALGVIVVAGITATVVVLRRRPPSV